MHAVLVSRAFQKQFQVLDSDLQSRIRAALALLQEDPYTPRSGADIRPLTDTYPKKYRLRVGDYRIIYTVDAVTVKVIEVFARKHGYRE
jgi:mRNA-degrading endonuclease RelE of RelBE toxin-antitoxin system